VWKRTDHSPVRVYRRRQLVARPFNVKLDDPHAGLLSKSALQYSSASPTSRRLVH